jgi:GNAT superfamily N-acetyltransferase
VLTAADVSEKLVVRVAVADDVDACVALLIASITTLCSADHQNDPTTLARWLHNKTPQHVVQSFADPNHFVVVAELEGAISGLAQLHLRGMITRCYVLPGAERRGVGRALIQALEGEASRLGMSELRLMSTGSARHFYEHLGYVADGPPSVDYGVLEQYPYAKRLRTVAP